MSFIVLHFDTSVKNRHRYEKKYYHIFFFMKIHPVGVISMRVLFSL